MGSDDPKAAVRAAMKLLYPRPHNFGSASVEKCDGLAIIRTSNGAPVAWMSEEVFAELTSKLA